MKATLESVVGSMPVMAVGVAPVRGVVAMVFVKVSPLPFAGQTMPPLALSEPAALEARLTSMSLRVSVAADAPRM